MIWRGLELDAINKPLSWYAWVPSRSRRPFEVQVRSNSTYDRRRWDALHVSVHSATKNKCAPEHRLLWPAAWDAHFSIWNSDTMVNACKRPLHAPAHA
eukprot:4022786-Amphidinium_carterae.1